MFYLLVINTLLLFAILAQKRIKLSTIKKILEGIVGLQEDLNTLTEKFNGMEQGVTLIAEDIAALKEELRIANENSNVDLSPFITRAENIEAALRAAAGSNPGSDT